MGAGRRWQRAVLTTLATVLVMVVYALLSAVVHRGDDVLPVDELPALLARPGLDRPRLRRARTTRQHDAGQDPRPGCPRVLPGAGTGRASP